MNPQQILDDTITEEPPPFGSIAGLMARERRRARGRRLAAVAAATTGVLGLAAGALALADVIAPGRTTGGPSAAVTATGHNGQNMAACLNAKGWDVVPSGDGWETPTGIREADVDAFNADVAACMAQFGYDTPLTPEIAARFYDNMVASAQCLRDLGYEISAAPDREWYIQQILDGVLPAWNPHDEVPTSSRGAATLACPPTPFA